jgi:arylsulfatase A-like enzyme
MDHAARRRCARLAARAIAVLLLLIGLPASGVTLRLETASDLGTGTGATVAMGGPRGKWSMLELGFRTPVILSWPDRIFRGVRKPALISTVDLFPTLLEFAGIASPSNRRGRSLQPFLDGAAPEHATPVIMQADSFRRKDQIVHSSASALRNDSWHYFRQGEEEKLFAIERDPDERHDVAREHPELLRRFRAEVERWNRDVGNVGVGSSDDTKRPEAARSSSAD